MPHGDKSSYTPKQKRKTGHIGEGYEKRGVGKEEALPHANVGGAELTPWL